MKTAKIMAIGKHLPEIIVDVQNEKEKEHITDAQIARMKIGKVHASKPEVRPTDMAIEAGRDAFSRCLVKPEDIDLVIYAYGFIPDYLAYPDHSRVQDGLGMVNATSFSVKQGCNGLMQAIEIGKAYLESGKYKNIFVVGSDKGHPVFGDRWRAISYGVIGEGAAAAILSMAEEGISILSTYSITDGFYVDMTYVDFGMAAPPDPENFDFKKLRYDTIPQADAFWQKKGGSSLEFLPRYQEKQKESLLSCLREAGKTLDDVDFIVDYNMSYDINKMFFDYIGYPVEKTAADLHAEFGHMGPSDVLINLDVLLERGRIKKGDVVLLTAAGAGITWGNCLLEI